LLWAKAHGAANNKTSKRNRRIGSPHSEEAQDLNRDAPEKWLRGRSLL